MSDFLSSAGSCDRGTLVQGSEAPTFGHFLAQKYEPFAGAEVPPRHLLTHAVTVIYACRHSQEGEPRTFYERRD